MEQDREEQAMADATAPDGKEGDRLVQAGHYEQALAVYEQAMRHDPSSQLAIPILALRGALHHPQAPAGQLSAELLTHVLHGSSYRDFFREWHIPSSLQDTILPGKSGRYRVASRLCEGELTTSYLAHDLANERPVLVKVLDPRALLYLSEVAPRRLGSNHPHLERLFGYGVWENCFYLITECLEGPTLQAQIAASAPLAVTRVVPIVVQIAQGLEELGLERIREGMLEPADILLIGSQEIKLIDPGLFSTYHRAAEGRMRLTMSPKDICLHTNGLAYRAPETALESCEPGICADLYSLACILFELLAGHPPYAYAGKTPVEIVVQHLSDPIPSVYETRPDLAPAFDAFFQRALAKNPGERYQTTGEFLQAFEALPGRGD
jgi:serine/threonine protein kinase